MKYLLDSNTFIEAYGRYYGMSICPAYWSWLVRAHEAGQILSINLVKQELEKGGDDLASWVVDNQNIFIGEERLAIQQAFQGVAHHISTLTQMNPGTHEEFLSGADPWLIATAIATNSTVVTQEVLKPSNIKRKIHIPNVCESLGVPYMNTFEMLHKLEAEFILSA
ncbi:DUF4411 family protein [Alteromonas australica]|jgi:predicted nucleic acid-binding protein|uniref:DUF4411 family protein n=1 Tax=Alteromonas australica TaxID=589873 RepID=UPI0035C79B72